MGLKELTSVACSLRPVLITALLFCVAAIPLAAQTDAIDYNRERIWIEYRPSLLGRWSEYRGQRADHATWRYCQGFHRVREAEFLAIAGYEEEAESAARHASINGWLLGSTLGMMGTSLTLLMVDVLMMVKYIEPGTPEYWAREDRQDVLLTTALIIDLSAIIPAIVVAIRGEKWMGLQQAYAVAESYNDTLR
jgi:hypothetical protein